MWAERFWCQSKVYLDNVRELRTCRLRASPCAGADGNCPLVVIGRGELVSFLKFETLSDPYNPHLNNSHLVLRVSASCLNRRCGGWNCAACNEGPLSSITWDFRPDYRYDFSLDVIDNDIASKRLNGGSN